MVYMETLLEVRLRLGHSCNRHVVLPCTSSPRQKIYVPLNSYIPNPTTSVLVSLGRIASTKHLNVTSAFGFGNASHISGQPSPFESV
jgi:hypothetical protein